MTSPLLTKREAAERLRVSTRQIDRYVAARRLRRLRLEGGRPRFRASDVDALVVVEVGVSSDRLDRIVNEWRAQHHQSQA